MNATPIQVQDDPQLLNAMMHDMSCADFLYRPSEFWTEYQSRFLPELLSNGLCDLRRRRSSAIHAFGGSDGDCLNYSPQQVTEYFYERTLEKFSDVGLNLNKCPSNLVGNPDFVYIIDGQPWTITHLQYCSMFADALHHVDLPEKFIFCEIGAGLGRNPEIIAALFPDAIQLIFDIPPQLYVLNQYLKAILGDRVVGYKDAIQVDTANFMDNIGNHAGKVFVLPVWLLPKWRNVKINLFWNSASFQEMTPQQVKKYLSFIRAMCPEYIYINAVPYGNNWFPHWKEEDKRNSPHEHHYISLLMWKL